MILEEDGTEERSLRSANIEMKQRHIPTFGCLLLLPKNYDSKKEDASLNHTTNDS